MFSESPTRKTIGLIFSIIGSLVLVGLLIIAPVYNAFTHLFSADNLATIIKTVDYRDVLTDNWGAVNEDDLNTIEIIDSVMKTDAVNEILDLYVKDINNNSIGKTSSEFNEATINKILTENSSAIVDQLAKNPNINISKDELQAEINSVISEHSGDIADLLPSPETMTELFEQEDINIFAYSATGSITYVIYLVFIVGITIGIFFAKLYRLKGLIVLGIDYIIGAVLTFGISALLGMDMLIDSLNAETSGFGDVLVNISHDIRSWAIVVGILAVVFLIVGIIGGKICKNFELSRAATASSANPYTNANPYVNPNPYANPYANNGINNGYNNNYNNNNPNNMGM